MYTLYLGGIPGANIRVANNMFQQPGAGQLTLQSATGTPGIFTYAGNTYYGTVAPGSWFNIGTVGPLGYPQWVAASGETGSQVAQRSYPDPGRTIATYMSSIGGSPSLDAFVAQARQQSRANWRPEYTARAVNDYIRQGFNIAPP